MKNKLRAIANWILVLTMPIWFVFAFLYVLIHGCLFDKNENRKKINREEFKSFFIEGKDWFWQ